MRFKGLHFRETMKPIITIGIVALLLWALVPGAGELLENAVHLAESGHLAHAAPDGDHHDGSGPEHGCSGTVHLCSCCASLSFLPARVTAQVPDEGSSQFTVHTPADVFTTCVGDIDRPPRA